MSSQVNALLQDIFGLAVDYMQENLSLDGYVDGYKTIMAKVDQLSPEDKREYALQSQELTEAMIEIYAHADQTMLLMMSSVIPKDVTTHLLACNKVIETLGEKASGKIKYLAGEFNKLPTRDSENPLKIVKLYKRAGAVPR